MPLHAQLPAIRKALSEGRLLWKRHALERMLERGIPRRQVKQTVIEGEIVEQYPDDYPIPSLLCGRSPCMWCWPGMKIAGSAISLPPTGPTWNTLKAT
jgi:hypothetical protein